MRNVEHYRCLRLEPLENRTLLAGNLFHLDVEGQRTGPRHDDRPTRDGRDFETRQTDRLDHRFGLDARRSAGHRDRARVSDRDPMRGNQNDVPVRPESRQAQVDLNLHNVLSQPAKAAPLATLTTTPTANDILTETTVVLSRTPVPSPIVTLTISPPLVLPTLLAVVSSNTESSLRQSTPAERVSAAGENVPIAANRQQAIDPSEVVVAAAAEQVEELVHSLGLGDDPKPGVQIHDETTTDSSMKAQRNDDASFVDLYLSPEPFSPTTVSESDGVELTLDAGFLSRLQETAEQTSDELRKVADSVAAQWSKLVGGNVETGLIMIDRVLLPESSAFVSQSFPRLGEIHDIQLESTFSLHRTIGYLANGEVSPISTVALDSIMATLHQVASSETQPIMGDAVVKSPSIASPMVAVIAGTALAIRRRQKQSERVD